MTNVFILCDLVWTVQKSHAVNRESKFNSYWPDMSEWPEVQPPGTDTAVQQGKKQPF